MTRCTTVRGERRMVCSPAFDHERAIAPAGPRGLEPDASRLAGHRTHPQPKREPSYCARSNCGGIMVTCSITECPDAAFRVPSVVRPSRQETLEDATEDVTAGAVANATTSPVLLVSRERGVIEAAMIPVGASKSCDDGSRSRIREHGRSGTWAARRRGAVACLFAVLGLIAVAP